MRLAAFDVETGGIDPAYALQPFRATQMVEGKPAAWLTSYAMAKRAHDGFMHREGGLWPTADTLRTQLQHWVDTKTFVTCWNAPFDVAWLIALGLRDLVFQVQWLDGMLLYKHLTSSPRYLPADDTPAPPHYGLKIAVEKFYPDEAGYEQGVDFADESPEAMARLLSYNKLDCEFTLRLTEKFWRELNPAQKRIATIEARCIPLIADSMVRGITTDTVAATELSNKLTHDAAVAFVTLKMGSGTGVVTEAVLASPKQLGELLYDSWGLPVVKMTEPTLTKPHGSRATDKEALIELATIDPRARLVRDYREAHNNQTKFADATVKSTEYNGDGCTRPQPRVFGTYTGRLTYSSKQGKGKAEVPTGIALHQWKNGKDFRRLLTVPDGYTLLEHDFAGQEFKWMAVESKDRTMLELCAPGEDPHSFMAARIERRRYRDIMALVAQGDEAAKATRKLGKVSNLSLQYRTGYKRLRIMSLVQHNVVLSEPQARSIHATYRTTYLGVPVYWKRQVEFGKLMGYAENLAGRRVQLGYGDDWAADKHWSYESTAINFPIQGIGADQKYLALAVLRNYLPSVEGYFYYELHDGLFSIVPDQYAMQACMDIQRLLSNLPYKEAWGKTFPIQFPVDAKLGKSWGDLKEVH